MKGKWITGIKKIEENELGPQWYAFSIFRANAIAWFVYGWDWKGAGVHVLLIQLKRRSSSFVAAMVP